MSRSVRILAPAKVNLSLRIMGRRPDGYHDLETVFQAVDLVDELVLTPGGSAVTLAVTGADLGPPKRNLAMRAAEGFRERHAFGGGIRIELLKRIPAGAGLGGGSSDAGAVLKALAWMSGVDRREEWLFALACELGSDVPFFLGDRATALAAGRGEILGPVPTLPVGDLVLSLPPVHVATAWAYGALGRERESLGAASASRTQARPLEPPRGWASVAPSLHNDFERLVAAAHPEVTASLRALRAAGAAGAVLSGSGAASFGLFSSRASAERAAARLGAELGWPCLPVRSLSAMPGPVALEVAGG